MVQDAPEEEEESQEEIKAEQVGVRSDAILVEEVEAGDLCYLCSTSVSGVDLVCDRASCFLSFHAKCYSQHWQENSFIKCPCVDCMVCFEPQRNNSLCVKVGVCSADVHLDCAQNLNL